MSSLPLTPPKKSIIMSDSEIARGNYTTNDPLIDLPEMPGLVRKLLLFATVDGLILHSAQQAVQIDYKGNVGPVLKDKRDEDAASAALETHGIVGMVSDICEGKLS